MYLDNNVFAVYIQQYSVSGMVTGIMPMEMGMGMVTGIMLMGMEMGMGMVRGFAHLEGALSCATLMVCFTGGVLFLEEFEGVAGFFAGGKVAGVDALRLSDTRGKGGGGYGGAALFTIPIRFNRS